MITLVHTPNDINPTVERIKKTHLSMTLTVQPFILLVGTSFSDFKDIYVVVDDTKYKFTSTLKAVDICFKIFQIFNLEYPKQSLKTWILLQKYLYNINTKYDGHDLNVETLIQTLSQSCN